MKKSILFMLAAVFGMVSCEGFLDEDNKAKNTSGSVYSDEQGFEMLVNACYSPLRDLHKQREVLMFGTDTFDANSDPDEVAAKGGLTSYNEYHPSSYGSQTEYFSTYFDLCYQAVSYANAVIDRAPGIEMADALRTLRTAEAKVLRALFYFYLVEQFGDVPLVLNEVNEPVVTGFRSPEKDVYEQIVSDITTSLGALPDVAADYGRVTRGMAKHLLAKVYLTRGYKSFAHADDFANAAKQAEEVIGTAAFGYGLLDDFGKVFEVGKEVSKEIVFAVQYSDNSLYNGLGNDSHMPFGFQYDGFAGMERSAVYGRMQSKISPSRFLYGLYGQDLAHDSRFDVTFLQLFKATVAVGSVAVGDTTIFFPRPGESWTQQKIDQVPYHVVNAEHYKYEYGGKDPTFPPLWKFREPGIPYGDNYGVRDFFLFRLAETYLIAAEAHLKDGKPDKALPFVNDVRRRAAIDATHKDDMEIALSDLTLDFILDERARELCGEEARWMELKRCGKLVERTMLYNPRAKKANCMEAKHALRPLPHAWFERLQNRDDVAQNPGFDK